MPNDRMDPREELHRIPSPQSGLTLFLRRLSPEMGRGRPVLYVHGATFPSALSIAHRFPEGSWRDALVQAGFDVWALDFHGFGRSDKYPAMSQQADCAGPLLLTKDAACQLEAALRFIIGRTGCGRVNLVAHSWGTAVAGLLAGQRPDLVDRVVLFGPISRRDPPRHPPMPSAPAWRIITVQAQWDRFVEDVPAGEPALLSSTEFDLWAERYLDTDAESRSREPAGVKVPFGPFYEILRSWHGTLPYDPGFMRAPTCLIRGEWDGLATDDDGRWLFDALVQVPEKRDIKIGRGTHLLHLEKNRTALWRESIAFLEGGAAS